MARRHTLEPYDFLPLTPAIAHILLALADEDRHGYAVMQEVERMTDGAVRMGPGTLYGTIKRMIASRLIEEAEERPDPAIDDERRRYYRATALGRAVLAAETDRMARLVGAARAKRVRT
jgi:DNA-binding PadR family transcriptional regulator